MTGGLPSPDGVPGRAADLAASTGDLVDTPDAVNVHVAPVDGGFDPDTVDPGERGYEGANAGDLGRLAAAVEAIGAVDAACLHHPEPAEGAEGPWLVVEPLTGMLSTVHAGRGALAVDLVDPPDGVDAALRAVRGALADVLEAVRPAHEHYPVERDEIGVFTRGMTTLAFEGVDPGGDGRGPTVRFEVSTTPDTRAAAVEALVTGLDPVREARYEPVVGVVRSEPPPSLLRAAEAAVEETVGDWEYEWYPSPTVFSELPTAEKLALGTGAPGERTFDRDRYECCRAMVRGTVERYGGA
jgi:hypothetical protein